MGDKTVVTKQSPEVGLRKRQQIASSNKAMFVWVAGASVLVAFAIVISIFLVKQIIFTERILVEKGKTVQTLSDNIKAADDLDKSVKKLRADKKLTVVRSSSSDNNLDVVIDAMPYAADEENFAASLQSALLTDVSIDNIKVNPTSGSDTSSVVVDTTTLEQVGDSQPITFSFKATGNSERLEDLFDRLNRSIRPIKILTLQLESAGAGKLSASVQAATYYQPKKTLELQEKTIKP